MSAGPGTGPLSGPPARPPTTASALIRLVTRLVVAQSVVAAAVGLLFSRRQISSIVITLGMVAAMAGLAVLARSGTRPAWLALVGFETAFFLYGLSRFLFARYLGGTLFALVTAGALLHPVVARSYGVRWGRRQGEVREPAAIGEPAPEALAPEGFTEESYGENPVG